MSINTHNAKNEFIRFLLDGSWLTRDGFLKQLPFIMLMTIFAMVYIGNRFHAEKLVRKTVAMQNELKELRSESISIASELMFISKQSEVSKMVEANNLELREAVEPPKKIRLK